MPQKKTRKTISTGFSIRKQRYYVPVASCARTPFHQSAVSSWVMNVIGFINPMGMHSGNLPLCITTGKFKIFEEIWNSTLTSRDDQTDVQNIIESFNRRRNNVSMISGS